jgi:hypothetical protein
MPTDLQTAAREYVSAGLHILALTGKRPNGRVHGESWSWDDSFHGTPTYVELEAFERAFSESQGTTGIAILIPPDFYVADVDTDRAAKLLLELGWEHHDDDIVALTKNGLHVWFWCAGADRNRWVGDGQEPNPGRTLLFKGHGGYVVAPPSLHFADDGTVDATYEWVNSIVAPVGLYMPSVLPEGVRQRFHRADQFNATKPEKEAMTTFTMKPADGVPWYLWEKVWDYQTAGLERAIETAADGNQNAVIHWAACVCRDEGVPFELAMTRLLAAAIKGGHPRTRARDTIKGVYKRVPRG